MRRPSHGWLREPPRIYRAAAFRKSSFCANRECVEVAGSQGEVVLMRDSKDQSGALLEFSLGAWDAFIRGIKAGEFDKKGILMEPEWKKSSYSFANGNCIEIQQVADSVWMRDSKHPAGPLLRFTLSEWDAFISGVRNGEFDDVGKA
jgi:hypothetical protein